MAGPVKGTIGNDEVTLNDAATETTLLKMLAALEGKGSVGGGGGGKGAGNTNKEFIKLAQQTGKTTKELDEFEEQIEETSNAMSRGFGHVLGAVQGLAHEFMGGATSISDFTSHITGALSKIPIIGGPLGGVLQLLVSVVDQNLQTFREMSQVGMDFGDSLMSTKLMATQAGLSLETFGEVVAQNATTLALFGGNASEGGKRFAAISGQIQKQFGPQFSRLGLTMEETSEYVADYLEIQTQLGRSQKMSNRELVAGAANMTKEVDLLSRVTGKRRDQIMAEIKEANMDNRLKLLMAGMDEKAKLEVDKLMVMLGTADPRIKEAAKELIATGGIPLSQFAKDMVRENASFAVIAKNIRDQAGTADQFVEQLRISADEASKVSDGTRSLTGVLAATGSEVGQFNTAVSGLTDIGKKQKQALLDQQAAEKSRGKALGDFERVLQNAKNKIYDALIKSGMFTTIENALGSFVKFLNEPEGIKKLESIAKTIALEFQKLQTAFENGNLMDYLKGFIKDGLSGLGGVIGGLLSGLFSGGGSEEVDPETGEKVDKKGSGFGIGLDAALGTLAGLVAVGGSVYLAIKGFQLLLRGFGSPGVILGAGVLAGLLIGTGAAIKLAGDGIKSAGDGIEAIASGVERMAAVKDTANIKDIAVALGDLGSAMIKFAGANLISGIGSLFGGDNVFDTMVTGISKFAKIEASAISNVAALAGTGLESLGDAMIKLSTGGIIDSIGSFFGVKSPFEKMVTGINEFSKIDATAVANLTGSASGLANLKSFTDDLDADGVKDYAKSLKELAEAMRKLNVVLADSNSGRKESGYGVSDLLKSEGGLGGSSISNSTLEQLMRENNQISRKILQATSENTY